MKPIIVSILTLALALTLQISGCSHVHSDEDEKVKIERIDNLVEGLNATRYSDIYFSAQPPLDQLDALKAQGFANIVNLRQPKEGRYEAAEEERQVKAASLNYTHIPIKGSAPLTDSTISEITQSIVSTREEGKTLVHCSSGNRVALWVGSHFYKDHGVSKEDAYKIALEAGLNKQVPQKALQEYLSAQE